MKEKWKTVLYRIIYPTCAGFTVLSVVFTLIIMNAQQTFESPGLTPKGLGIILLFCFLEVCAGKILTIQRLAPLAKLFLHFIATMLNFLVIFLWLGGYYSDGGSAGLMVFLLFGVIYLLIAVPIAIYRQIKRKRENENESYHSMLYKEEKNRK